MIHYVAINNELVEIESDTIKKSKSLIELQNLEKNSKLKVSVNG